MLSGIVLWVVGRANWHVGASGLIYAIAFFLFFSGLIRKHIPLIAISLVITMIYGSMFWQIFPWQKNDPVSWEGHLSGGITGLLLAVAFRMSGPQKPQTKFDDEETEDENDDFEFYIESDDDNSSLEEVEKNN